MFSIIIDHVICNCTCILMTWEFNERPLGGPRYCLLRSLINNYSYYTLIMVAVVNASQIEAYPTMHCVSLLFSRSHGVQRVISWNVNLMIYNHLFRKTVQSTKNEDYSALYSKCTVHRIVLIHSNLPVYLVCVSETVGGWARAAGPMGTMVVPLWLLPRRMYITKWLWLMLCEHIHRTVDMFRMLIRSVERVLLTYSGWCWSVHGHRSEISTLNFVAARMPSNYSIDMWNYLMTSG